MSNISQELFDATRAAAERTASDPLRYAFRNADDKDWEHLFLMLPDSGHGKFWKAVMTEARRALATPQ